jgi:hypothetical protein
MLSVVLYTLLIFGLGCVVGWGECRHRYRQYMGDQSRVVQNAYRQGLRKGAQNQRIADGRDG